MNEAEIQDKVCALMAVVLEVNANEIAADSRMDSVAAWDSLKHMKLIMALEQELDIEFDDEEIVDMLSVPLIVLTVKAKLAA